MGVIVGIDADLSQLLTLSGQTLLFASGSLVKRSMELSRSSFFASVN